MVTGCYQVPCLMMHGPSAHGSRSEVLWLSDTLVRWLWPFWSVITNATACLLWQGVAWMQLTDQCSQTVTFSHTTGTTHTHIQYMHAHVHFLHSKCGSSTYWMDKQEYADHYFPAIFTSAGSNENFKSNFNALQVCVFSQSIHTC